MIRVLSLGAGVQSSTVYLMAHYGEIEPFDHVIFADTGWEPRDVYEHLSKLQALGGTTIDVVTVGNIRDDHLAPRPELLIRNAVKHPEYQGKQRTFIPFYVVGDDGKKGRTFRTCTKTYKIEPVEQHIRKVLGLKRGAPWPKTKAVEQSMGISLDEVIRMKTSRRAAIELVYPLIDMRMTRDDCHAWLAGRGWTAPRSACIGCPFHRNDEWRRLRDESPVEFFDAVNFDEMFRLRQRLGLMPIAGVPYLHDSRVPLAVADIDSDAGGTHQGTIFGDECEGLCGT